MTSEMMPLLLTLSTITISLTVFYFTRWKRWRSGDTSDKEENLGKEKNKSQKLQNPKSKSQSNGKQTKKPKLSPKVNKSKENTDHKTQAVVSSVERLETKREERKPPRKSPAIKKSKVAEPEPDLVIEDDVGFSFFKSRREENLKKRKAKLEETKTNLNISELKAANVDSLGFSFVPHKDRRNLKKIIAAPETSPLIDLYCPNQRPSQRVQQNKPETIQHQEVRVANRVKFFDQKIAEPLKPAVVTNTKGTPKCKYSEIVIRGISPADFVRDYGSSIAHQDVELTKEVVEEPVETFSFYVDKLNTSVEPTVFLEADKSTNFIEEEVLVNTIIGLDVEPTEVVSISENVEEVEEEVKARNCFEEKTVIDTNGFYSQNSVIDDTIKNCCVEQLLIGEDSEEINTWNSIKEQVITNNFSQDSDDSAQSIDVLDQSAIEEIEVITYNCFEGQTVNSTSDQKVYSFIDDILVNSAAIPNIDDNYSKLLSNEEIDQIKEIEPCNFVEQQTVNQLEINSQIDFIDTSLVSAIKVEPSIVLKEEEVTDNSGIVNKYFQMEQVRVLVLNDKEHNDSTLYRIKKNWILQFRLGPSLLGRKVTLLCNYPNPGEEFNRNTYHALKWHQDSGCSHSDDTALLAEIKAAHAGSFHYYFIYDEDDNEKHQGSGFFLVDPVLKFGKNEDLPLDCIQCQTVMAKHLGTFDTWENKLRVGKEAGYNMIHFTPIQKLGSSNSGYSLSGQLQLNPAFNRANGKKTSFGDVEQLMKKMRCEWKVTSICDIVLNHTANESEWLLEHPEATYNCSNCTHLRPAYLLDAVLHQFSIDVSKGLYEDKGIPVEVSNEDHLQAIRYHLHQKLSEVNISELYICDVNKYVNEFLDLTRNKVPPTAPSDGIEALTVEQDPAYKRLSSTIDIQLALKLFNVYRSDCFDEDTRIKRCNEDFKNTLNELNNNIVRQITDHLNAAVENCVAGIRYFRVDPNGPKLKEISVDNPLVPRYFTDCGTPMTLAEHQKIMYDNDKAKFLMAHNGWVMNADPLKNFATPGSNVYLRRELIAWGDSVKLRYGDKPEDSPFLWNHMRSYVEQIATIFDGVRLDNCHSTPIPVAEYLLDCARKVRPDLYVVAELFTNSDMTDNIFVNRLGITSLIREALSAWNSHEQGRLVYRYGGVPVGSFYQPNIRPLVPSIAHAMFLDLTHDNPSPVEKRSVYDLLPSTALVNMACCASGSNRGYDELVPHHIHVVEESRQYTEWSDDPKNDVKFVNKDSGIILAKRALNDLHFLLGSEGFDQVYVDQMDPDVVAVTRHCPKTHQSYILVAFTAFQPTISNYQRSIRPLRVEGHIDEIVMEASLVDRDSNNKSEHVKDPDWINGLKGYKVILRQHVSVQESEVFHQVDSGTPNVTQLNFKNFKHGSIVVVKVSLPSDMLDAIKNVQKVMGQFSAKKDSELSNVIGALTLPNLNRILYRCGQEERDEGNNFDTYNIPNFGSLVYAGLQGFMSVLSNIRPNNDLGHPLCDNLRNGDWMIDYVWKRLKLDSGTAALGQWFEENTKSLKVIPRYLIPCYFDAIITGMYVLLIDQSYSLMSRFVKDGSTFVKGLSMGSLQFAAYIKSADLPQLSPKLKPPPPQRKDASGKSVQACVTLSAGLPHFSTGYMRNWGRDTFIALRGLFLLTGRYEDARYHILGYAACLRHGLIPNLLDGGRNSRFNCRDAVWWWLYCIKCYVEDAPNGVAILSDMVSRIFPTDDSPAQPAGAVDQPLCDVIQEALNVHFQGLSFRERNAGRQIDEHMTDNGFNNQIGVHPETGFVFGGNGDNCGTWMDKMGSSDKAGNRGKPATPRDGSAVELIGLSKAGVSWLHDMNQKGRYPYDGVERTSATGSITKWTFKSWADRIQENFEKYFWVNTSPASGDTKLINKRGIYKDCHGASQQWTDYQLRCNFPIAMVAAPELFDPHHAWTALQNAEKYLLGPLGMKTLDPDDWAYNGDYDNSNDSDNPSVSHGFNYHQGPEWVWPVGFFLRAKIHFASANNSLQKTLADTKRIMSRHFVELQTSPWRGLPELTNKNGAYCSDSSRTQAWSMSCILEVLHDLRKIELKQPIVN